MTRFISTQGSVYESVNEAKSVSSSEGVYTDIEETQREKARGHRDLLTNTELFGNSDLYEILHETRLGHALARRLA